MQTIQSKNTKKYKSLRRTPILPLSENYSPVRHYSTSIFFGFLIFVLVPFCFAALIRDLLHSEARFFAFPFLMLVFGVYFISVVVSLLFHRKEIFK